MQVLGGGGPLLFCVMKFLSCPHKVVGWCERFSNFLPMFDVVLCGDVVRELFASSRVEVSRIK